MPSGRIYIGTSGWHYAHWVGPFYPTGTAAAGFLPYYTRHFDTVEINATFYRLPTRAAAEAWHRGTPEDFVFACKASRFITHMKKLRDPRRSVRRFFRVVRALGRKLGPILFQLPPRWHVDVARLDAFLRALPGGYRYAFEFRDETWFRREVYEALAARNAALCIFDLSGRRSPVQVTADFVYIRLHGPAGPYQGTYDRRTLAGWARRCLRWAEGGSDVFCYFDNDEKAYAARNALTLLGLVARGRPPRARTGRRRA